MKLGLGTQENRSTLDIDGFPSKKRLLQEEKEVKKMWWEEKRGQNRSSV